MLIAADEVIPYLPAAFSPVGEVRLFSGRSVRPVDIRGADALIVRSITRVDANLLEGSSVRFVATASIGMDHLDLDYLRARGIQYANAAGSNANSVAEYVMAALLAIAERRGWILANKSIGIIGVGHVGSRVAKMAAALGMEVLLCDPPLREATGDQKYGFLEDVLGADILTLHVPLTAGGPHPTLHMISSEVLRRLSSRQLIINTSRGAVVCAPDLKQALLEGRIEGAALDVWENEPRIDRGLLELVDLGTAHVAGSSLDGKVRGTEMILEETCRFFGSVTKWDSSGLFAQPRGLRPMAGINQQDAIRSIVLNAYDIRQDDERLRRTIGMQDGDAAALFDSLRNRYVLRPEFAHFIVETAEGSALTPILRALGFQVTCSVAEGG